MKLKHLFIMVNVLLIMRSPIQAQLTIPSEIWDSVKTNTHPIVVGSFTDQYETPFRMPLADYGWEDGLQISSDGLNLYALYAPADLLSWVDYINLNIALPPCDIFGTGAFLRTYADDHGMDMTTNIFGCDTALNIDILYAHRNSLDENFESWELSGMQRPAFIEGGPFPLQSSVDPNVAEHFLFTGNNDIWMINNTSINPENIASAIRLPEPINPASDEFSADNPILKRINNSDTLLLIYEKYTDGALRDFMYVFSYDDGLTWDEPTLISSLNNDAGHLETPQLYFDGLNTYLYYGRNFDIYRSRQAIPGNWDSWVEEEMVISKGNALALGEPSFAPNGDMSFVVAYQNTNTTNPNDRFDADPWYVKNNFPPINITSGGAEMVLKVFPNPTSEEIFINVSDQNIYSLSIFDLHGSKTISIIHPYNKINVRDLKSGLYFIEIITESGVILKNKIVIAH